MDFEDFFPSLSGNDVRAHFREHSNVLPPGWTQVDTETLVQFVCVKGQLTIGSVTSPALSNTLCYELDRLLHEYCTELGVTYTRYADDMFFSTDQRNQLSKVERKVIETVKRLECPQSLRIKQEKTRHCSRKGRMVITGLIVTPDGKVSLGRERKRRVKALVHRWDTLEEEQKISLSGYMAYCMAVEPTFVQSLYGKYGPERMAQIREFSFSELPGHQGFPDE